MIAAVRIVFVVLFLAQSSLIALAQSQTITTYAGPGLPISGTLATTQAIDSPTSAAPDGAGGFYVASAAQNRVYRVAADGTVSLIAGSGSTGFSGDGGPATSARLNNPLGLAADAVGNLYVAD